MTTVSRAVLAVGAAACGFLITAAAQQLSALPQDKKAGGKEGASVLEGGYTIVSGESDGKAIPEAEIKGSIVRFTGNKILGTDKDKKEFFAATFTLTGEKAGEKAGEKGPWMIKMKSTTPKEAEANGMVKKDGDTVTIIYDLKGGTPKEFKTKDGQNLFVLKNMNKEPGKGGKDDPDKFKKGP